MALHAKLSASGAHRWIECPASIQAEDGIPDSTSSYAAEGSAAHAVADYCLANDLDAIECLGWFYHENDDDQAGILHEAKIAKPFKFVIDVDESMCGYVQEYVDYCNSFRTKTSTKYTEKRVDFSPWVKDGFGTSDDITIDEVSRDVNDNHETILQCRIIDLKFGQGNKVFAFENVQEICYALGVMNDFEYIHGEFDEFVLCIHQPRLDHVDEWVISRKELLKWGETIKAAALDTAKENPPFNPGEKQCQWCKASGTCKPYAEHVLNIVSDGFDDVETIENVKIITKDVTKLDGEGLANIYSQIKTVETFIKSLKGVAYEFAERNELPGFKIVAGKNSRSWKDEQKTRRKLQREYGLKKADLYTQNFVSPAQAEALKGVGKKNKIIDDLVVNTPQANGIAPLSDKRPAINIDHSEDFEVVSETPGDDIEEDFLKVS